MDKSTVFPEPLKDSARVFLRAEIKAGRNDSGLPQQFVTWVRTRAARLDDSQALRLFLDISEEIGTRGVIQNGRVVFVLDEMDASA